MSYLCVNETELLPCARAWIYCVFLLFINYKTHCVYKIFQIELHFKIATNVRKRQKKVARDGRWHMMAGGT